MNLFRLNSESILKTDSGLTQTISLYCDGDSITERPDNYTGNFKGWIEQNISNTTLNVTNVAVSGQSSQIMLSNLQANILANNPDIITLCTMLNDTSFSYSTLYGYVISYIDAVLNHINPLTGKNPQLILITDNVGANTFRAYTAQVAAKNCIMDAYNIYLNNPNIQVMDMFSVFDKYGHDTSNMYQFMIIPDYFHPNAWGYTLFNQYLNPQLLNAVKKVRRFKS